MTEVGAALAAAHPKAIATLVRLLGDITVAEDALQDAVMRAIERWPVDGIPANPAAWVVTTARRRAVDGFRRQAVEDRYAADPQHPTPRSPEPESTTDHPFADDLLRLIFTCCHPVLPTEAQVALTLKVVAGRSVAEIAQAFLVAPRAMEQRLTRAKRRLREARVPYEVPEEHELPERLRAVLSVVYLIFNAGYSPSDAEGVVRPDLCDEAIHLSRMLLELFPEAAEVEGLLALCRLQHSRSGARVDEAGDLVPLDAQDRKRWDASAITEGVALVERALRRQDPGPYQIQAAIAAVHAQAPSAEETDWSEIAELYRLLERELPTAAVRVNRALAVGQAEGPLAGLALLEGLEGRAEVRHYHHFHTARATLLRDAGRREAAVRAYREALVLVTNPAEADRVRHELAGLKPS